MEPCKGRSRYIDLQTKQKATSNQPTTTNLQEKKTPSWKTQPQCGSFISSINFTFPRFAPTKMVHFPYVFQGFFGSFFFVPTAGCFLPSHKRWGWTRSASACGHKGSNLKLLTTGKKTTDNWEVVNFFPPKAKGNPDFEVTTIKDTLSNACKVDSLTEIIY